MFGLLDSHSAKSTELCQLAEAPCPKALRRWAGERHIATWRHAVSFPLCLWADAE